MPLVLYYEPTSPPCRAVLLAAAALGVKLDLKLISFDAGDLAAPDFIKLNPQHTVPTLVDDGFSLWESRAISRYLVNKYGGGKSSLYPKDPQAKALVDQRLDFDLGTLYERFADYCYPPLMGGPPSDPAKLKKLEEALGFLNTFLETSQFAAGSTLTLADLSLVASVSSIEAAGISLETYPKIQRWFERVKATAPEYEEANGKGTQEFKEVITKLSNK